jgi:glycosyltransferase involved in cell wall biosynthesis
MSVKKILLIGEFSNLHWTLAQGLRKLGHQVVVVSNGDGWKNIERDIDIKFRNSSHKIDFLRSFFFSNKYKGFDVVQLIGCPFLFSGNKTPWNKFFFKHLKKHNKKIFLGAFGDDYYYQNLCVNGGLKYSPFLSLEKNDSYSTEVLEVTKMLKRFNEYLAKESDGIIAGCYDYYKAYDYGGFVEKLKMIPFPINTDEFINDESEITINSKINFFVGVQKRRSVWKGTDVFMKALEELSGQYPEEIKLTIVSDIPYKEYVKMYKDSDVIVDQLYSYSSGMNALISMAQGKAVISGGEQEMYQILNEKELKPIINFDPNRDIKQQFLEILKRKDEIPKMKKDGVKFVKKHHYYVEVAKKYVEFWSI